MIDEFPSLSAFVAVAESGSFVAAARRLGLTESAVGKSVKRLEERMQVRLFHRTTRAVRLTAEGLAFLARARRILNELQLAQEEVSEAGEPRGRLRISLPLVSPVSAELLARFQEKHPRVLLDLNYTDRLVDLVVEGFDVGVRTGELADSRLMSRRLLRYRHVVVGAPGYLVRRGRPTGPGELAAHTLLRYRFPMSGQLETWRVQGYADMTRDLERSEFAADSLTVLISLAAAGRGLAFVPEFAVAAQLRSGELERVLADHTPTSQSLSLVWVGGDHLPHRVRSFVQFLSSELAN